MLSEPGIERLFRSLVHVNCPDCGEHIIANFARRLDSRTCISCGCRVKISAASLKRFPDYHDDQPLTSF